MRKYKQVKRKEVIFSIDEWKLIEERAAAVLIKTGEFIRHIALTGHVSYTEHVDSICRTNFRLRVPNVIMQRL